MPDVAVIFFDGTIGGEIARASDIHDRGMGPDLLLHVHEVSLLAGFHVSIEVGEDEELVIMVHDLIENHTEAVGIAFAPRAREEAIHDAFDAEVAVIDIPWGIGAVINHRLDLIGLKTEDDFVLFASKVGDLDVRAVQGAKGDRAVHHELHVGGTGSFFTSGRDLLGDIGCWDNLLSEGDTIILNEDDLHEFGDLWIVIDDFGDR